MTPSNDKVAEEIVKLDQTKFGNIEGNCFETCLAMLLGLRVEDVPCYKDGNGKWFKDHKKWVKQFGFDLLALSCDWSGEYREYCPQVYSIVSGKSPRGDWEHSVVYFGAEIFHDPHPDRTGLETVKDWIYLVPSIPNTTEALSKQRQEMEKKLTEQEHQINYLKNAVRVGTEERDEIEKDLLSQLQTAQVSLAKAKEEIESLRERDRYLSPEVIAINEERFQQVFELKKQLDEARSLRNTHTDLLKIQVDDLKKQLEEAKQDAMNELSNCAHLNKKLVEAENWIKQINEKLQLMKRESAPNSGKGIAVTGIISFLESLPIPQHLMLDSTKVHEVIMKQAKQIKDLEKKLEAAKEALKPFAKEAESWPYVKDNVHLMAKTCENQIESIPLTVKDLRRSNEALKRLEE